MENPVKLIGEHPYISAGVVFGVGLLVVISLVGNSSSSSSTDLGTDSTAYETAAAENNAANATLVGSQLSAQVANNQTNAALAATQDQDQTAFQISQLQFDLQNNANVIAGNVATAQISEAGLESNNSLAALENTNATNLAINQSNNDTALGIVNSNNNATIVGYNDQVQINGQNNGTAQLQLNNELTLGLDTNAKNLEALQDQLAAAKTTAQTTQAATTSNSSPAASSSIPTSLIHSVPILNNIGNGNFAISSEIVTDGPGYNPPNSPLGGLTNGGA